MLFNILTLIACLAVASASSSLCIKGCCDHTFTLPSKDLILDPLKVGDTTKQHITLPVAELRCCPCENKPKPPPSLQPGHPPKEPAIKLCGEFACCPIDCHCQPGVDIDCSEALKAIHSINRNKTRSLLLASPPKTPLTGTSPITTPPADKDKNTTKPHRPRPPHGGSGSDGGLPANCPEGACDDSEFWPCLCIQALTGKPVGEAASLIADEGLVEKFRGSLQGVMKVAKGLVSGGEGSVADQDGKEEL